jgi:hypothetical protein
VAAVALAGVLAAGRAGAGEITVSGTSFLLDGKPFPFTGVTFFNAIYNPALHETAQGRRQWLAKFKRYGINVLRVWAQWDSKRGMLDTCAECSLYQPDGSLRPAPVERLQALATDADAQGMVIELALFAQESWHDGIRLGHAEADRAVEAVTHALLPHHNVTFQIWNEFSERVLDHLATIKRTDSKRVVTNSPGFAGVLGDDAQNRALDYLSPHTSRQSQGRPWEVAPREIEYLLARFRKPVVDDEPARNGTTKFGGPGETTYPTDHILQIAEVWRRGGHVIYHHDMFQTGAGTPSVPPLGIPDPEWSPYHRVVFQFLAQRERYHPTR